MTSDALPGRYPVRSGENAIACDPLEIRVDDLTSDAVQSLISEHLQGMHGNSPAGHVNALTVAALRVPDITFWTAWRGHELCGCGALKELGGNAGEIKSMRTRAAYLGQGVGQALLNRIISEAANRGYKRIFLETGTGEAFAAAHALYLRNGFDWCGAFADYTATEFNVFMVRALQQQQPADAQND